MPALVIAVALTPLEITPENVVDVLRPPLVSVPAAPPLLVTLPAPASDPMVSLNAAHVERRATGHGHRAARADGVGDARP